MPDWKKIKAEYLRGGTSYQKLSQKYGVPFSSIRRKAEKENWTDLKAKTEQKMSMKIVESVANQEAKKVDKIQTIADMLLDKIIEGIESGEFVLQGRGYRDLTGALKDIRDIKGIKSELDLEEQLARIEKLRKEAQTEEASKDIKVVISSELDDFSK